MAFFTANVDAALNQKREENYEQDVFSGCPLLGLVEHKVEGGDAIKVTFKTGFSPGAGARYADVVAQQGESQRTSMLVTPTVLYASEDVDNPSAVLSERGEDAVIPILSDAQSSAMSSVALQLDQALFSDGYGSLFISKSHTGTTGAGSTITATIPSQIFKVQPNQLLVSKATPAAGALDTGSYLVTGIDEINGILTVTPQGGASVAVDGHVFGLYATMAASTAPVTYVGLTNWLTNDPTLLAASLYGAVRTGGGVHLAGHVLDGTKLNIVDAVNIGETSAANIMGAKPDLVLLSSANYNKLRTQLADRAFNVNSKGDGININYSGFSFMGNRSLMTVHMAPNCSSGDVFVLDSRTWHLAASGKELVTPNTLHGGWVDLPDADKTRVSMRALGSFYTHFPGANARVLVKP